MACGDLVCGGDLVGFAESLRRASEAASRKMDEPAAAPAARCEPAAATASMVGGSRMKEESDPVRGGRPGRVQKGRGSSVKSEREGRPRRHPAPSTRHPSLMYAVAPQRSLANLCHRFEIDRPRYGRQPCEAPGVQGTLSDARGGRARVKEAGPRPSWGRCGVDPRSFLSRCDVDPVGSSLDAVSVLGRCGVDPRSILGRCDVDPGSARAWSEVDRGRFGVDPRSFWGRSGVDLDDAGSI